MKRRALLLAVALIVCIGSMYGQSVEAEFAMFKRIVSPVMKWGVNGLLTVPKASTIGKLNLYAAIAGQEAGVLEGLKLYNTSLSLMVGSSEDVELGYTRRQLLWEDFYFSDLSMDTFHLKARVLDMGDFLLPQVAIGTNLVSLVDNTFTNKDNILFNVYAAATSTIPIFTPLMRLSVTAVAETIMNEGELGVYQFSGGADLNLFNLLYIVGEVQGFNPKRLNDEFISVGAKLRIGPVSAGVGMLGIRRTGDLGGTFLDNIKTSTFDIESARYMATVCVELDLGKSPAKKK
jgi:hypothetical protein